MDNVTQARTTAEDIANALRAQISSGALAPNTRITEQALAEQFGTSRTPVREAMRLLVVEGFLTFKPNSGSFVRKWRSEEVEEIFSLRVIVESEVAAEAARHISRAELDRLTAIQDAMETHGDDPGKDGLAEVSRLNRAFHKLIAEASRSPRLVKMLEDAVKVPIVQSTFSRYAPRDLARSHHHHRELIDAMRAQDPGWAKSVMRCHILSARSVMRRHAEGDPAGR